MASLHFATAPSRSAALARLASIDADRYARTRNHLDGAVTGLSPYLTHGLLTLPEVLAASLERQALGVQHKLVYELGWREFFRHAWQHAGSSIFSSLHAGPRPESAYAPELPSDIREARTGLPVIDAAVRHLYATGTLHNHARMWLASYVVHIRGIHWRAGADWLVAHLLDGDLASNHLSWQWVAGTGSHKPYLFNAENVARYAPSAWHSPGSAIDTSYEVLDRVARGLQELPASRPAACAGVTEPALLATPPTGIHVHTPDAKTAERLRGRNVWLVHPWALRPPPAFLPEDTQVVGVFPAEHHAAWPWPAARWEWVHTAMSAVAEECWFVDKPTLTEALRHAASVSSFTEPHLAEWFPAAVRLEPAPALFPAVERQCTSFSQWWTRATKGLKQASELL